MRKTVRAAFESIPLLTKEDISKSEILKNLLKQQTPIAIQDALEGNKIYASLFEINATNCFIEIHKKHWSQALETCLVWYVEEENYEMCNQIKNLIHGIQEKTKRKIVIKKQEEDGE